MSPDFELVLLFGLYSMNSKHLDVLSSLKIRFLSILLQQEHKQVILRYCIQKMILLKNISRYNLA